MNRDIKKDLISAHELRNFGEYNKSLEIYKKLYKEHPEAFNPKNREDFAWLLYNMFVKYFKNEEDFFSSVELITELVPQRDLKTNRNCVYTASIFRVLKYLDKNDYYTMLSWLDRIDTDLLDEKAVIKNNTLQKSKKELYFEYASRAYLNCEKYEECINVSKLGLDTLKEFNQKQDLWLCWRIGKSLSKLERHEEAITYLNEALKLKKWYVCKNLAECYYYLGDTLSMLKYACPVMLADIDDVARINLYCMIYNVFKDSNPEIAMIHIKLYYLIKEENEFNVPDEIKKLNLDDAELNRNELEFEIINIWNLYKKSQEANNV